MTLSGELIAGDGPSFDGSDVPPDLLHETVVREIIKTIRIFLMPQIATQVFFRTS